ncbi:tetraspanin-8-like [Acipenser ruthenus]|uniref:tetraspanin-8-like n=1 Tax=Acipenser ruthenus TaxID=7906 RepID=UPI00145A24EC|nr:tetraspanin-8-like [Acipenser ruthenus]
MAGVSGCMKYSMFFFNFLFWLCGCFILGVSIWLRVSKDVQHTVQADIPAVNLMIAIGAIIMGLGFFGCCGAIRESRCLLLLFFIGLLLIFILLVTAGILGVVYRSKAEGVLTDTLQKYIPIESQPAEFKTDIENLQTQGKCCGLIKGAQDWGGVPPASCNCSDDPASDCTIYNGRKVYKQPCLQFLTDMMAKHAGIILGVAFGLAVVMLFGLGFSMSLYCQIGRK